MVGCIDRFVSKGVDDVLGRNGNRGIFVELLVTGLMSNCRRLWMGRARFSKQFLLSISEAVSMARSLL